MHMRYKPEVGIADALKVFLSYRIMCLIKHSLIPQKITFGYYCIGIYFSCQENSYILYLSDIFVKFNN